MKVALLGLPGAGKTSLGRRLSSLLSIPCIDVDDDILEPTWGCTVAEKLAKVGDQKFLQAEEEALRFQFHSHHLDFLQTSTYACLEVPKRTIFTGTESQSPT